MSVENASNPASFPGADEENHEHRRRYDGRRDGDHVQREPSPVPELVEPVLVDPEVVGQLVEDGDPDLMLELRRVVPELVLEREPVDRDLRRHVRRLLEQPEEVGLLWVLVLDDDRDVLEPARQVGWQRVESPAHVLVERPPSVGRAQRPAFRHEPHGESPEDEAADVGEEGHAAARLRLR